MRKTFGLHTRKPKWVCSSLIRSKMSCSIWIEMFHISKRIWLYSEEAYQRCIPFEKSIHSVLTFLDIRFRWIDASIRLLRLHRKDRKFSNFPACHFSSLNNFESLYTSWIVQNLPSSFTLCIKIFLFSFSSVNPVNSNAQLSLCLYGIYL